MSQLPQTAHPTQRQPPAYFVSRGAGLAFILAAIFMLFFYQGAGLPFGLWTVLPLLTVPVAGVFGGLLFYLLTPLRQQGGGLRMATLLGSAVIYAMGLWLALVAAFAVTGLWD